MKKYIILLTSTLIFVLLFLGCSQNNISSVSSIAVNKDSSQSKTESNPFIKIKDTDIAWITKRGGLPSVKVWKVLFPKHDFDKISKLLNLINSNSNIRKSTEEDLDFLNTRHGYPVNIVIKLNDSSEYSLETAMKLTTQKTDKGTETTGTIYKDRIILTYSNNSITEYYTVFGNDIAEYVSNTSNPDFPRVDEFSITPENFKYGDRITISGDGCTEDEVNICLSNGNDADKEEYIIGKAKSAFGVWKWEGVIDGNIKTYDGKDIKFSNNKFFIEIQIGEERGLLGQEIIIPLKHS